MGDEVGDPFALLHATTLIVDLIGLAAALWLGLYVVGRSPRRPLAWLTALSLWSAAGVFLNGLLALNPPPDDLPTWLRLVLPFWPARAGTGADARFFHQGWAVTPAVIFWHHATLLLRPERIDDRRRLRIGLGYLIALAAILVQAYAPQLFATATGGTLYHDTFQAGPLYPLFALALLIYTGLCLSNLSTAGASQPALQAQLRTLTAGTLMAGASAPLFVASTLLKLHIPLVLDALFLAAGILWIGYGVVRYSAFLEGRVAPRDFVYQAAAIGAVTLIYLAVTWFSVAAYHVPGAAFTFIVVLAVITHSLVGSGRSHFDWLFFRSEALHLRRSFRRLAMLAGERESLEDRLRRPLETLCRSVSATYGLIYLDIDGRASLRASFAWSRASPQAFPFSRLAVDDLASLRPGHLPTPLADVCLLAPLYREAHQLGALLLGCPRDALGFNEADLDLIAQASDRFAATIENAREQEIHLHQIETLVESDAASTTFRELNIRSIESALRNLFDFAYLGNHPLAQRLSLQRYLPVGEVTHLERGRALHNRIADAIEQFRPHPDQPTDPPPRQWYPYIILHSAYLDGTPNRDIMARLYVSEGTFNRTRRAAVQALALALEESEAAMRPAAPPSDSGEIRRRGTTPNQVAAPGSDASGTGVSVRPSSSQDSDDL